MILRRSLQLSGMMLLFLLAALDVDAQEAAQSISVDEVKNEDTYLAGKTIHIFKQVNGDLVAAAQKISVEAPISQDVIAAGERITLRAEIGDDVRLAGRSIHIDGSIGDDLIAAGDTITVDPGTTIGGRVWAAGRSIDLSGLIGKSVKIAAQDLTINSVITGDVDFTGERIEVLPGTRISGSLTYRSQNEPLVSADAKIEGGIKKKPSIPEIETETPVAFLLIFFFFSLLTTVVVIHWLFPTLTTKATEKLRTEPLKCIGLGLAMWLVLPVAALLLMITVVGLPLGLVLIVVYPIVLFFGFIVSINYLGQQSLTLLRLNDRTSVIWTIIGAVVALIVFALLFIIPILGTVIIGLLLLGGLGGFGMEQHRRYVSQ